MSYFYRFVWTLVRIFLKSFFGLTVSGAEKVPKKGRIIIAANHVSGFDPPVVGVSTDRELFFLAKKELFKIPLLGLIIRNLNSVPVDRGAGDIRALKTFISILENDNAVILFPEGTRSRNGQLGEAKEGIGFLAMQTRADILPVYVDGTYKIRQSFFRRPGIKVTFGKQIHLNDYDDLDISNRDRYKKISVDVLEEIRRLRDEDSN